MASWNSHSKKQKCVFVFTIFALLQGCASQRRPALQSLGSDLQPSHEQLTDYGASRSSFLKVASHLKRSIPQAEVFSHKISSTTHDDLFIDSLYLPSQNTKQERLIIVTSGIHGLEAGAGSWQERLLIRDCFSPSKEEDQDKIDRSRTGVLFLHTLNPYGFKNQRRLNSANTDLNRNFFDAHAPEFPGLSIENTAYESVRKALETRMSPVGLLGRGIFQSKTLNRALSGQYRHPKGLYYGGRELQPENRIAQELMRKQVEEAQYILHIDLHTGFGDRGISQIMLNPPPQDTQLQKAYDRELKTLTETLFPAAECEGICRVDESTDHDFLTQGDITQWLHNVYPSKRKKGHVLSVTSEIGTEGPLKVLPALVNENFCFHNPSKCSEKKLLRLQTQLKNIFIPDDDEWVEQLELGTRQLCRALARFSRMTPF